MRAAVIMVSHHRIVLRCRAAADPDLESQVQWDKDFVIGSLVDASVHEVKDYGVVFDFAAHADVLGLAATHQVGPYSYYRSYNNYDNRLLLL